MRKLLTTLALAALSSMPAFAQVSVSIGINVPVYPDLRLVPGYPVYYAPSLQANYFFYDGYYWVFASDGWYVSPWYDGPWQRVSEDRVPLFVLRVPLRYYGYPPARFSHWIVDAPPRWDVVWGPGWARRHHNWQRWNRSSAPHPAPLPSYQQRFSRDSYPNDTQRRELQQRNYGYTPRDKQVRHQWQADARVRLPSARPDQQQHSQAPQARPADPRGHDPQRPERGHGQAREPMPPQRAPVARPEPPPVQAREAAQQHRQPERRPEPPRARPEIPRAAPMPMPAPAEDRGAGRGARPDHRAPPGKPDRGDKDGKHDKDGERDPGKRQH